MERRRRGRGFARWGAKLFAMAFIVGVLCCCKWNIAQAAMTGVLNLHQAYAGDNYFEVQWDKDIGAVGYEYQYSMDGNNWSEAKYTTSLLADVNNLNSGRSYYVRVRSYDRGDAIGKPYFGTEYSEWCAPIEAITMPKRVDTSDVKQTDGSNQTITVSWEAADGATTYEVMYSTGSSWFSGGTTTATTYTLENLEPDTTYYVSIKAIRESANGYKDGRYYTSGHYCHTTSPKIKSTALKSWDTKTNEISLSWDSVSGTCSGYEVYVTNFSGKKIKNEKVSGNGTSFKLASVKNQGFIFKVRAYIDIDGTSIYGNWSASKTVVAQPKVTLKQSGSSTINVSWSKVTGASSYTVYRSTRSGSGFKKIKTTTGTKLTNKGLNEKETYYYYVVANGVKVNKKTYKSTTATYREIAYLAYNGQTSYYH